MPYVMMPVPEEHVEAVMQFVLRAVARASIKPWDAESVAQIFEEVDESTRSLLAFVARAALENGELADVDAARMLQITVREVAGIMNELVALTRGAERANLISSRTFTEKLPNGRSKSKRVFLMEPEIAAFVGAAEQAELRGVTNLPDASG